MNLAKLLDDVLKTGTAQYERARQSGDLNKYATGAAVGGALALLLGSRRGRSLGGSALKYGSLAAIGALAWKAYQEHQAKSAPAATAAVSPPRFEALPAPQLELHGQAMLKAMIAAAKSDGHFDDRERGLLEAELARLGADTATRSWVAAEMRRPVEPADVAASCTSPEMAAEIYLASLVVADETTSMERAYLDQLAVLLGLEPALKADLEAKARA
jgi:uncharacterized membrane protein YebE (DUF533 family)